MSHESGSDSSDRGTTTGDRGTPPAKRAPERSPWALAGLGMQFFASLVLFVYGGSWLDTRYGTSPLFLMLGLFVGAGGSFYLSYRRLTAADRRPN